MIEGDDIIHQQHRLRIMAALDTASEPLDFAMLKAVSNATDGNLGAHLQTLEKAGYIVLTKESVGKRSRTWASVTPLGLRAFRNHVAFLEDVLNLGQPNGSL